MPHQKSYRRFLLIVTILVLFIVTVNNCGEQSRSTTYDRLRAYVETIKVVNTHEHQNFYKAYEGHDYNFYTVLSTCYVRADLVSAGGFRPKAEDINRGDLDELWDMLGQYLNYSQNTSYYTHLLAGFQTLYGYEESNFSKEGIAALSKQIKENYRNRDEWYKTAFGKAGFEVMFLDLYWDHFNAEIDSKYFALVFNITKFITYVSERTKMSAKDAPARSNPFKYAEKEGYSMNTLDDYLMVADRLVKKFLDLNMVCFKNTAAYWRTIDFQKVSYERAKKLYARPSEALSKTERKELQDFVFHWFIEKSIEVDLPIQIHTGYLAGNGNTLENSRPTLLNNLFLEYPKARFVIFHGGYPWTGEFSALGKMFPNVYLDLVWLAHISREAAVRGLDEMLDTIPYNKFFWGGDCDMIEESAGTLKFGKDVVAQVLASRVDRGLMSEEVARDVALKIFRENALRYFKLEEILDKTF